MVSIDLSAWAEEEENPERRRIREALHVLLYAIASSPALRMTAAMKGGILMAIRHGSSRFTRDIDFSSRQLVQEFDIDGFLTNLGDQLAKAVANLSYDIECIVQSHEMKPSREDATHPTLQIRIG